MSGLAEVEIARLEADGIRLTPREIVAINGLSWAVETPWVRSALAQGRPVPVGGVVLWPLTIRGAEWFKRVGCHLRGEERQTQALAFAMVYGRTDGPELDTEPADEMVKKWARRLRCTSSELVLAIDQVLEQDTEIENEPVDDHGTSISYGELSASIVAEAGGSPAMWERQVSIGYVLRMLTILAAQKGDGEKKHDPVYLRANRALGMYCEMIRARHRREHGQ